MPLYEYACNKCGHHFDTRHSADEKPVIPCPQCDNDTQKVFNVSGIIFKGSGWYIKDSTTQPPAESSASSE